MISSGAMRFRIAAASRIFSALGESREPKFECDSSAALGSMPKRRISSAASTVISAISSADRVDGDVGVGEEDDAALRDQHGQRRQVAVPDAGARRR